MEGLEENRRNGGVIVERKELLSIVVPVFNEAEVIPVFYERTKKVLEALEGLSHEIIFMDDGSKDDSYNKLRYLGEADPNIRIIKFSRNFGHQVAISAGLDFARGDAIVIIDSDLQDPPEVIPQFIEKWREGYDVVYGIREKREGERKFKLITATLFYRLLKRWTNIDIPMDVGDFRLISRRVADQMKTLKERDRFVRGLVSWVGFSQTGVYYLRDRRYAGETKYPFKKMFKFALDGITGFSVVPLKLASWLGYVVSIMAFIYACSVFIQKALGITVQGWATIMVAMLFLGGVQLICIGIVGEYLARVFNEIKQRPMYIVEDVFDNSQGELSRESPFSKSFASKFGQQKRANL